MSRSAKPSPEMQRAFTELVAGSDEAIKRSIAWLRRLDHCKVELADALMQCLDAASLSDDCKRRAFFDLRNWINRLNALIVDGLNDHLSCFGDAVRERFDPYAKDLLRLTFNLLGRPPEYDEQFLGSFVDRFTPAISAFGREGKKLAKLLLLAQGAANRSAGGVPVRLVNEPRDKWLYEQCRKGTKYSTIESRLRMNQKGWSKVTGASSIRAAAARYARRNGLPVIPRRQHGAPKKAK
jgi:hypothetical protein